MPIERTKELRESRYNRLKVERPVPKGDNISTTKMLTPMLINAFLADPVDIMTGVLEQHDKERATLQEVADVFVDLARSSNEWPADSVMLAIAKPMFAAKGLKIS